MATTVHYISITDPSNPSNVLGSGGASGAQNINDGVLSSTSPSTDAVGVWWTDTGVLATRTTRKQLLMALVTIMKFIVRGGYGVLGAGSAYSGPTAGYDPNIPT